jgi:hypothetical protein
LLSTMTVTLAARHAMTIRAHGHLTSCAAPDSEARGSGGVQRAF